MMHQKAIAFNDSETAHKILCEYLPANQKKLGREIKNFNEKKWDEIKYNLVKRGLKEKFNQNPQLKRNLLKFRGYQFVEASPKDRIWGIGFGENDAIKNIENWGENLLGKILTELATELA